MYAVQAEELTRVFRQSQVYGYIARFGESPGLMLQNLYYKLHGQVRRIERRAIDGVSFSAVRRHPGEAVEDDAKVVRAQSDPGSQLGQAGGPRRGGFHLGHHPADGLALLEELLHAPAHASRRAAALVAGEQAARKGNRRRRLRQELEYVGDGARRSQWRVG